MRFEGRTYDTVMGSDVERDGMFLELDDITDGERETVAEWFYSDAQGSMEFTEFREVTGAALEWFRDEAARRLPPRADAV